MVNLINFVKYPGYLRFQLSVKWLPNGKENFLFQGNNPAVCLGLGTCRQGKTEFAGFPGNLHFFTLTNLGRTLEYL
jgi:hypothetical protein